MAVRKKSVRNRATQERTQVKKDMNVTNQIRERAYLLYLDRAQTQKPGDQTSDWLQAEQQVETLNTQ